MKRLVALAVLGMLGPIIQGAISPFLPRALCPDVGLLLVVSIGLTLRNTLAGVALAAWIGFVSDLLSGSLLGQHAMARVFAYAFARLAGFQMNLHGMFAQVVLTAVTTIACSTLLSGLTAFFTAGAAAPMASPLELAWHAGVNALAAPFVVGFVAHCVRQLGDDGGRRMLPIEPRSFA